MSNKNRLPVAVALIQESLGVGISSFKQIKEGQDGEKFLIETSNGDKLFCRVKKIKGGQELPYQEAAVLEATSSPHIVKPTKVDELRGYYIIIRPYVEGVTLSDRIGKNDLTPQEVLTLTWALIDAIENLREAGAVHFDIKPENIVCGINGIFYLIDFGAAKIIRKIKDERLHPARRYIAPEVLEYLFNPTDLGAKRLSVLTDMYGVGAVLYTAVTGRRLTDFFSSSSDILQKVPPAVRHIKPDTNPNLADLIDRLLAKNPSRRLLPRDARALLEGKAIPPLLLPNFFLKTKGGRGSEHSSMLPVIEAEQEQAGIYWKSASAPVFPKRTLIASVL